MFGYGDVIRFLRANLQMLKINDMIQTLIHQKPAAQRLAFL